ncbi:MAG: beta-lactamase [Bacteroidetes bacterium]|jgi:PAT family beta-lactamase induction signal transducer AmpG|nr:beta-lactamase [Bacteroidota bacterium]
MPLAKPTSRNPWAWVTTLYFAEGIPYVVVMTVSVIMYKRLGISNTDIALYTSWLYLPWVIKPLWSPVVELFRTKRFWIVAMQLIIGAALAAVAFTIPIPAFFQYTLAIFWLMAFSSATHDIAADGFYMLGLPEHQQAAFVGVRSTFYRFSMITGQGLLVVVAGQLETRFRDSAVEAGQLEAHLQGSIQMAWAITFGILAALFLLFFIYHKFILPYPVSDAPAVREPGRSPMAEALRIFALFFKKKYIVPTIAFLLLYRFAEAQLVKLVSPFLLDSREVGGLGLTTSEVGIVYGTVGIIALTLGGLLGGFVVSRHGLKTWLWPMVFIIHTPDLAFVYLSQTMPENFFIINCAVALEQFGYGFGFTAYMMYMILVSAGEHKTAHYAICTGFMALGMMIPGMFSGAVQEWLGYQGFFLWVILSTIPGFLVAALVKIPAGFGKKAQA